MDTCHNCGELIKNAEVPVTFYVVAGPAVKNVTPEEAVKRYGERLSPFIVALLSKRMARGVYCGGCASTITADVPPAEVQRLTAYAASEK